ncbi:MAG: PQQ-dependent dehydrogenase, methanol/ethanol family [Parvibaculum sp.]|uniref:PQQ-dependent dehydrogenase, methanol/ethanol family n=1 Tax=Parvibaculum sp. TaxID=2024848 RepID=UPI0027184934|nr:PQQ-dependent dehydrogenase, methanol/ethanol family [Parvibaculum sp.]MDO8837615.1 PQQ-dependent dehydrogenase, methanol/ethanol family [Parvibaculum sp.]
MADLAKNWPVAVNAAAGVVLAGFIGWQLISSGVEETASPVAEAPVVEEVVEEAAPRGFADIDGARIAAADAEPGNWLSHGRTYDEQRFSPLDQINDNNIGELALAWSLDTATTRGLEATPIVVDDVMYLSLNWGITIAVDAKSGTELWRFDPEVPGEWGRYGCCDVVNRGVAVWKGRVYTASFDGRLFALDATDGAVVWEVNTIPGPPYTITGAPRVFGDKVVIGNGGAEYGVRGYITAYDTETGAEAWRFYTVPGDPALPVEHPELEAALPTWKGGEWWKIGGGGTAWDSMVYEPETNTLYVGTGNGSPWTREIRSPGGGDNLYLSSILALDADSGRMKWHYQTTPGDNWDYTATQPLMLADIEIDGRLRNVIMQAPKNGFFYVLDRETGKLISANPFSTTTWASHIDLETGRPVETGEGEFGEATAFVLPSANGAHNWHPMAFHPGTGLVYIPTQDIAGIYSLSEQWKNEGAYTPKNNWWNTGMDWTAYIDAITALPEIPMEKGYLKAWDPVTGEARWQVEYPAPLNGGVLATAGNLVFQGTADGYFYAYKADTGERVWSQHIQTGIVAAPVTYTVDGEQYVAVLAGWGGVNIVSGDARTSAAAKYGNEGRLITFKLGGGGTLPQLALRDQSIPEWPALTANEETVRQGEIAYTQYCMLCHGALAISPGVTPDLRRMNENVREHFQDIVRGGLLSANGMASFADLVSEEDVEAILSYVQKRALEDKARAEPTN